MAQGNTPQLYGVALRDLFIRSGILAIPHKTLITYLAAYLVATGTAIRYLSAYRGSPYNWIVSGLLVGFLLLLAIEPWLSLRSQRYTLLYLALQTGIIITLSLLPPHLDYFSILYVTLILQMVNTLSPGASFGWISVFITIMTIQMLYGQGWNRGLPFVLIFVIIYSFFGSYAAIVRRAEAAREESQRLLAELESAHQQMQVYTAQAEELAVVAERNRLARNLHDAVTQTIFSITLRAAAARLLYNEDPAQVAPQLQQIQMLSKSALAEMRSLIFELRPTIITEQGLIPALHHHIVSLERQHGLMVAIDTTGEFQLPLDQAQGLFRIIQEALKNVVKHAQTDKASVTLKNENNQILLQVEDHGKGFAPETAQTDERSIGLFTMRERVEMLRGTLKIDTRPGEGTRLTVEIPTALEHKIDG